MKSWLVFIVVYFASFNLGEVHAQVILEVPGYAILNGTTATSTYSDRLFYAFRSVYYAEKPTPETRFLVPTFYLILIK